MNNIFDYFDNKAFREANKDKEFNAKEKIALIIHSKTMTLEDKFNDLLEIANEVDLLTRNEIRRWIEYKKIV